MIESAKGNDANLKKLSNVSQPEEVFAKYDKNSDGFLDFQEFSVLINDVYASQRPVPDDKIRQFMTHLDINKDGRIDANEFSYSWTHCFKKILNPVKALLVIDVQYDFIDGSLALRNCPAQEEAAEVVPVINSLIEENQFDLIVYSLDWHPQNHISFFENRCKYDLHHTCEANRDHCEILDELTFDFGMPRRQILWPTHCVQNTAGAELDKRLKVVPGAVKIYKGTNESIDSYSAFFDNERLSETALKQQLESRGVTDLYICGVAYDVCVAATAGDALSLGYRTVVVDDACRGVDKTAISKCKHNLSSSGACILPSNKIGEMVSGRSTNYDMGLFTAKTMTTTS